MIAEKENITIENFIFHVVHHGDDQPILMDETPIKGFEIFFKNRILEILDGNKFDFIPDTPFIGNIQEIKDGKNDFLEISKTIATNFHSHQDNRIKAGVMILMDCNIANVRKYILIKYDHENVIYYTTKGNKAILAEISNTFSKSKEALQKSAVIDLSTHPPTAIIVDKSERENVTQFFKNFLGIKRVYESELLTKKVKESYLQTVKHFKANLPKEYTSQSNLLFYETVHKMENFEASAFLQKAFGIHYSEEMENIFKRELKRKDINGEEFKLDKTIPRPKQKKFRTNEGVSIQFPTDAEDTVKIKHFNNSTVVTITTSQLLEE